MMRFRALLLTVALLFAGTAAAQTVSGGGVPIASATRLGVIKGDNGASISIDADGTAHAVGAPASLTNGASAIANGAANQVLTDNGGTLTEIPSTGTGNAVRAISPTLTTPALGTPSAVNLTNGTALPVGGISGLGTGVGTALGSAVTGSGGIVLGTSPTLTTPALGTPSAVNLTNGTALPLTSGVTGVLPTANGGRGTAGVDYQAPFTLTPGSADLLVSGSPGNTPTISTTDAPNVISSTTPAPTDCTTLIAKHTVFTATSPVTLTMPNVSQTSCGAQSVYWFSSAGSSPQAVTINVTSPSTINGLSSYVLPAGQSITLTDPQGLNYLASQRTDLGSIVTQNANAVAVTGGTINGAVIGGSTPAAATVSSLKDTGITGSTQCVHVDTTGAFSGTGSDCGSGGGGGGTVTTSGTPANGNLAKFSGATAITNGDISGDCTTSGALAITCTKTSGSAFAASATTDTTNASNISTGTLGLARGGTNADLSATGGTSRFLKQATTGAAITVVQPACGDLSNAATSCSTDATNATNISSGTVNNARLAGSGATTVNAQTCTLGSTCTLWSSFGGINSNNSFAASTTNFGVLAGGYFSAVGNSETFARQSVAPLTGTIGHFHAYVLTAPGTGFSVVFTVRNCPGGTSCADTALTCTIADTATSCGDDTHTVAITAGDLEDVKEAISAGATSTGGQAWSSAFHQ